MLFPKKVKFRKSHTMRHNPKVLKTATRGTVVSFGSHGLKATTAARVRSNQIESARKVIARSLGKTGKQWIRIFPDKPFTQKPPEVKLGKGKGDPVGYEVQVWPGRVLFEVDGVTDALAVSTLKKAAAKLPLKAKVVTRS
ncbi:50S ribosomal protein L16 [Candidatus Adlerbacteria bacterium RIFCSPHIGHO2_02_FULL_54_18]|uniref:50S ribosomal protein L16 n=2 Tax=Candidatus Adleribacteriota TaxID=1752736 RepID=A0A1F4Y1P5_9BACT|nr:MAG: 50S ribosomal protein L16 [Candidatus Adlerbacteria bacterium RIFCSPLOWO2_01_FULL_54_21b]OGC87900.1 MAG: 50S ribosomal protein L16 [Candidatus Adlerbacteria bacterium RIFCSPHIGHO2_02_FULL_54_18]